MRLAPGARSAAGYRLYDDGDLLRLQQADRRFAENIDKDGAGLRTFLAAAVRGNARRT